jgi:hypothetical protein
MSWLYSQALVAEYLAENSLDGEQSAPLNGSPTPLAFLLPDKMTAFSRLSRSGMTFAPLTEDLGEDVLTWFLEGFPARTSAAPERALESTESDLECGWKWHGSFAKWHPATSSWKTRQCSLLEGLEEFSETWPKWGSMQDGECLELATLERHIRESESGLWGTPRVGMARGGNFYYDRGKHNLEEQVGAAEYAKNWPTPVADGDRTTNYAQEGTSLGFAVRNWPTPQASDNRDRGNLGSGAIQRRKEKGKQIGLSQSVSDTSGALNPPWVEWLMAWPLEWTDLKPLETARFQAWLRSHGESLVKPDP